MKKRQAIIGWAALAILNCALLVPYLGHIWPQPHDFGMFYTAVRLYSSQPADRLYDLNLQANTERVIYDIPSDQLAKRVLPYNHLAYEMILWLPLAKLSPGGAAWVWRIESILLLLLALYWFRETAGVDKPVWELALISLAFFPVPFALLTGQDTFVTLAVLALGAKLLKANSRFWAGVVLGLGLFKFQLILPIIGIFFLLRVWKLVAGFAASSAGVVAASALMVGGRGMRDLLDMWKKGESGGISCIDPKTMPNLRGLLASVPGLSSHAVFSATLLLSVVLLVVVTWQIKQSQKVELSFGLALCFVILVSFHTNLYDMAILALPLLLLTGPSFRTRPWLARVPVVLLLCPPFYVAILAAFRVPFLALLIGFLWTALSGELAMAESSRVEVPAMVGATS